MTVPRGPTLDHDDGPEVRDVVVVGASAGGVEPLQTLVKGLPADFGAAVLVVLHVPAARSRLAAILDRAGPLPVRHAADGDRIRIGEVLVAAPDHHLVVVGGHVHLSRGPRENGSRPAVDVLFRSAARALGPRVIGVVLSGALDDGAAGLAAVVRAGGAAVVQDPAEAQQPTMPRSALVAAPGARALAASAIPGALVSLVGVPVDHVGSEGVGTAARTHAAAETGPTAVDDPLRAAFAAAGGDGVLTCPECAGPLLLLEDADELPRYVCRVGHTYAARSLVVANAQHVERALWTAVQTLEERALLTGDLARRARDRGQQRSAAAYGARAADAAGAAQVVRDLIERGATAAPNDEPPGVDELADAASPDAATAVAASAAGPRRD